jgi:hypothetical protein
MLRCIRIPSSARAAHAPGLISILQNWAELGRIGQNWPELARIGCQINMQKHITILAVLYIAFSALALFGAVIVFLAIVGGGLLSGDIEAIGITTGVGTVVAAIMLIFAAPGLIGGIGLLKGCSWAWILVLILGCLNLLNIPFGTALGAYTIWVLVQQESKAILGSS